jgi:hypothetical protein
MAQHNWMTMVTVAVAVTAVTGSGDGGSGGGKGHFLTSILVFSSTRIVSTTHWNRCLVVQSCECGR